MHPTANRQTQQLLVQAELDFIYSYMKEAPNSQPWTEDSRTNRQQISRVVPKLLRGEGVEYKGLTLLEGRHITRADDLEALRKETGKLVPKKGKGMRVGDNPPLPDGAHAFDFGGGWVIDAQLGIWNKAKLWAYMTEDERKRAWQIDAEKKKKKEAKDGTHTPKQSIDDEDGGPASVVCKGLVSEQKARLDDSEATREEESKVEKRRVSSKASLPTQATSKKPKVNAAASTADTLKAARAVPPERELSKIPDVPDVDVQDARILCRNSALMKFLRTHKDGDWVKNPHRKVAGKDTLTRTKDKAADAIKTVVREWLLETKAGRRALAAADIGEGELSIDRVLARHDTKNGMSLNCIYNLVIMPLRHNSYFGDRNSHEKEKYVGWRACKLAHDAHNRFIRDMESEYDWDVFKHHADALMMQEMPQ